MAWVGGPYLRYSTLNDFSAALDSSLWTLVGTFMRVCVCEREREREAGILQTAADIAPNETFYIPAFAPSSFLWGLR